MKKEVISFCLLIWLISCFSQYACSQVLLPKPQKIKFGVSRFNLATAKVLIPADMGDDELRTINQFINDVRTSQGVILQSISSGEGTNSPLFVFKSDHAGTSLPVPDESAGPQSRESYAIKVSQEKVMVTARGSAGIFYALQTLRQLIVKEGTNDYLREVDIEDYPSFAYRGIMMDFAHGGLLTEEEIKRQLDFLSRWKINQYYFYNEVSIEMKGYSLINYNAKYTQEQIKRIVAYGREKYIDVIPFVAFYGHLHELLRLQKYSGLGIGKYGHDLDPREPGVQALLKDWVGQYSTLFPGPFIHVGFDETWETERMSKTKPGIKQEQLFVDHLDFVTGLLKQYGKTVMVWTDISKNYPGIIAKFPKKVIPVVWDYGSDTASVNSWIKPIVKEKMPFFIQSGVDGWAHLYPTETTWDNIDICAKAAVKNNGAGYITSVWTDAIQPLLRNSWMFMAYGAVVSWQAGPVERNEFITQYSRIVYPSIADPMDKAFKKMAESQVYLRKCLGQTQTRMWINPFLSYNLKLTKEHLADFEKGRLAAEMAQEFLADALDKSTADSAFIKTMLLNCRLLSYTAMRFLWAKKMVDRWDESMKRKDDSWFSDINETPHGLIMDMMDFTTEIKEEYRLAWLSENMPYRLGTIISRFDAEYQFWRNFSGKVRDYRDHGGDNPKALFGEVFKLEHQ